MKPVEYREIRKEFTYICNEANSYICNMFINVNDNYIAMNLLQMISKCEGQIEIAIRELEKDSNKRNEWEERLNHLLNLEEEVKNKNQQNLDNLNKNNLRKIMKKI